MTQAVTLYHNPRCSKSRQALELLTEKGAEVEVVRYLDQPLTASAVKRLIKRLGISAHELLRTREAPYQALGLTPKSSADAVCRAVAEHPILMERPIAVVGERAVIGRPPERVLELL